MPYDKTERPNTKRHIRARLLLMKGTPVAEVAALLGHASAAAMLPYFLLGSHGRSGKSNAMVSN